MRVISFSGHRPLVVAVLGMLACSHPPAVDATADGADDSAAPDGDAVVAAAGRGTVTNVRTLASCPQGVPSGSTCRQVTVTGCPGITSEPIDAVVALLPQTGTLRGTVVHFSGGGGEGFQVGGTQQYRAAGFRNVYVAWLSDWEQTLSSGIKTAACRPATILQWIFLEPNLHGGSRSVAFCGEGFSGGSGQLGYALAHYGMNGVLDYVNELSGPPFARIDLGCNGDAPPTAVVCGATDTLRLPQSVTRWENIQSPLMCGSTNVPPTELARWNADSIAVGGLYSYPRTQVQFFACTFQATAVTAQGKIYFDLIAQTEGGDPGLAQYHCYTQADGCQGEGLGTGNADATQALLASCVPRHQ
jgi:hypothetical protein